MKSVLYLVKTDIISLLCLLSCYNEFYLVIMNYWPYGLPYPKEVHMANNSL